MIAMKWIIFLQWILVPPGLFSQSLAYKKDSIEIYTWLNLADDLDFQGKMDSANLATQKALLLSKDRKFKRGEGFAQLKIADLMLKTKGAVKDVYKTCIQGIELGNQIEDHFIIGLGLHQISQYFRDQAKWDSTVQYLSLAVLHYDRIKLDEYLAYAYNDLGYALDKDGDFEIAIQNYYKAANLFEKLDIKKELANTYNNIGTVFKKMNNQSEAIRMLRKSIQISESIHDSKRLAAAYGNLASTYLTISMDSAEYYQRKSLDQAIHTNVLSFMAQAFANTADLLANRSKIMEAIQANNKSIESYRKIGELQKLATRLIASGSLYTKINDTATAKQCFEEATKMADHLNTKPLLQNLYEQKSLFAQKKGDYRSALEFLEKSQLIKDSILNEKSLINIAEIQTKYEVTKKDLEILNLQSIQKIKQAQIENQSILLKNKELETKNQKDQITILDQQKQLNETKLRENQTDLDNLAKENRLKEEVLKNEQLYAAQKLSRERISKNIILLSSLIALLVGWLLFNRYKLTQKIKGQEQLLAIRNTISKDLHDEIGSTLTSISMLSQISEKTMDLQPAVTKSHLAAISHQSKIVQQNISDIVWSIRPDSDKTSSLISRIREFASSLLEPANIKLSIDMDSSLNEISLNECKRKEALLITKEALHNIVKHAHATDVNIQCIASDKNFILSIRDNGLWKEKNISTGSGLTSMNDRAKKINGDLHFIKEPTGTIMSLKFPIS